MVPVRWLLAVGIVLDLDLLAVRVRIQCLGERILRAPGPDAGPGPRCPLRDPRLVVAGPGVLPGPELAHVAGDDQDHRRAAAVRRAVEPVRSEEHTSELQSRLHLVCRLLLEKKKIKTRCPMPERAAARWFAAPDRIVTQCAPKTASVASPHRSLDPSTRALPETGELVTYAD